MNKKSKQKLTITIDGDILKESKKASKSKGIPLSRAIENFLKFFSQPWVYCFGCGERFLVTDSEVCPKCGWIIHEKCQTCRCTLSEETASAVFYMRKTFEDLFGGRLR